MTNLSIHKAKNSECHLKSHKKKYATNPERPWKAPEIAFSISSFLFLLSSSNLTYVFSRLKSGFKKRRKETS